MSNIGNYDNSKNSPDNKRQDKLKYAQQLADGAHAAPIDNGRYSLHAAKLDREKALFEQEMLNPNAPRRRGEDINFNANANSDYPIGTVNGTNDDRHRKQYAYAQQLQNDQNNTRRPSDAVGDSPSKGQHYRDMQEVYKREASQFGGLNIGAESSRSRSGNGNNGSNGSRSGRRSGNGSRGDGVIDEERRLKIEKQRLYAQSIQESSNAKPPSGHRVSRRRDRDDPSAYEFDVNAVPSYLEESPDKQIHSGRLRRPDEAEVEAAKKRQAQHEYYKQIENAGAYR